MPHSQQPEQSYSDKHCRRGPAQRFSKESYHTIEHVRTSFPRARGHSCSLTQLCFSVANTIGMSALSRVAGGPGDARLQGRAAGQQRVGQRGGLAAHVQGGRADAREGRRGSRGERVGGGASGARCFDIFDLFWPCFLSFFCQVRRALLPPKAQPPRRLASPTRPPPATARAPIGAPIGARSGGQLGCHGGHALFMSATDVMH